MLPCSAQLSNLRAARPPQPLQTRLALPTCLLQTGSYLLENPVQYIVNVSVGSVCLAAVLATGGALGWSVAAAARQHKHW